MGHPLIVEILETEFVPLLIKNNTRGDADAQTLKKFGEKTWNNPALRITDHRGQLIVPRLYGDWSLLATTERIGDALAKIKRPLPHWFSEFREELRSKKRGWKTAVFGMT